MSGDSSFGRITDAIEAFGWHPRVQVEQIPAPQRIAPHAYAVEASVLTTADDEVGTGRLIVLHDPNGNQAWNGNYRCVSYARADVDLEMVTDPLLAEVGYETAEITLKPAYEVTQITTALALVEAGLGIAVLPTYARAVAPASVLVRPLAEPSIARDIVMIRPGGRSASPALSAFEALLRRFVRQLAPSEAD